MKKLLGIVLSVAVVAAFIGIAAPAEAASSLVVAQDYPPRMMNPHGDDSDAGLSYFSNFFDGLLQRKGSEGELVPALAVKWEHPDLLTWRFFLRKGALKNLVARFARDERGATLVEYGVAVVLAVIVGTGGLIALSSQINNNMADADGAMAPAGTAAAVTAGGFTSTATSFTDTTATTTN